MDKDSSNNSISLLQYSLGVRADYPCAPSQEEWQGIFDMASEQGVAGICFAGIKRMLGEGGMSCRKGTPLEHASEYMLFQWMGESMRVEERNKTLNRQCMEVQEAFRKEGLESCIIKGQGVGALYGSLAHWRSPGDIDVWVKGTAKDVLDFVNARTPNREFDGKHTHWNVYRDTMVEVHWWASRTSNPIVDRRLRRFYSEQIGKACQREVTLYDGTKITTPDAFFNSIHSLLHIFGHFLYEGITLKQMTDYYFILRAVQEEGIPNEQIVKKFHELGIYDFSRIVMYIMLKVYGMPAEYLLTKPDAERGEALLKEIMEGDPDTRAALGKKESTLQRWIRRGKRKIRLFRYNSLGILWNPISKIQLGIWKNKMFKKYNL